VTAKPKAAESRADRLMEDASRALAGARYGDAERIAADALHHAHQESDYERMARIVLPLQEARRLRRQQAADVKKVTRIDAYEDLEPLLTGTKPIKPGCYLIEPMLVGADGRELRDRALADDVPVFVINREPPDALNRWPIVAVGPVTVRTRLQPPKKLDVAWMLAAGEALGDAALARLDPADDAASRADHLVELLAAVIDHEKLHQALIAACEEAARDAAAAPKKRPRAAVAAAADDEWGDEDSRDPDDA
jgi:hypothetical protein